MRTIGAHSWVYVGWLISAVDALIERWSTQLTLA